MNWSIQFLPLVTEQRTGERIRASKQEEALKTLFMDWVKEGSETGKKIKSLMKKEQFGYKRKLADEQNEELGDRKARHDKEVAEFV